MKLTIGARWHHGCGLTLIIALLLAVLLPGKTARAQSGPPPSYTFQECDQVKEAQLRDELNRITQAVFAEERGGIDVAAMVARNWDALNLDAVVDKAVDEATELVMEETGLWDRIISGWSPEKAEELTRKVATYAFNSPRFREAIDQLSIDVTDEVLSEIRLVTAKSASSALLCVQSFIGDSMSPTMAALLQEQIQERIDEALEAPDSDQTWIDIATAHPKILGGVGVIIGAQIAKRLGQSLAKQLAGKVVARILGRLGSAFVPLVGWLVGAGLIVWDLWNASQGSLPQIRDALQDQEVKEEIHAHVTDMVSDELRMELPQLARAVSNDVYSKWQDFRKKYVRVLRLAESNGRFRAILDNTSTGEVKRLAELVSVIESVFGLDQLEKSLDLGEFERILALPEEVLKVLRDGVDPTETIAWSDLAGEMMGQVIELELYRVASPSDFIDREDLGAVLALENAGLVQKFMLVDRDARAAISSLSSQHVKPVLDLLSVEDISFLAVELLVELEPQERNVLVDRILSAPELLPELKAVPVRSAILDSQNLSSTLNYIIQKKKKVPWLGKAVQMVAGIGPVFSGELPWALFWRYDGAVLGHVVWVLVGLVAFSIVWRRVFSSHRRQDINVNVVLPESRNDEQAVSDVKRLEIQNREEN